MKAKFAVILLAISIILSGCGSDNIYVKYYHEHPELNMWNDDQLLLIYAGAGSITGEKAKNSEEALKKLHIRKPITNADKEFMQALSMDGLVVFGLRAELHDLTRDSVKSGEPMISRIVQETHRTESKIYVHEKVLERALQEYNRNKNGLSANFFTNSYLQQVANEIYQTQLKDKIPSEYLR